MMFKKTKGLAKRLQKLEKSLVHEDHIEELRLPTYDLLPPRKLPVSTK